MYVKCHINKSGGALLPHPRFPQLISLHLKLPYSLTFLLLFIFWSLSLWISWCSFRMRRWNNLLDAGWINGARNAWRNQTPSSERLIDPNYDYESVNVDEDVELKSPRTSTSSLSPLSSSHTLPSFTQLPAGTTTPNPKSRIRSRLFKLILIITISIPLCYFLPRLIHVLHLYKDLGSTETFHPSYIPSPQSLESTVPSVSTSSNSLNNNALTLADLQRELAKRLNSLGMPADDEPLRCTSLESTRTLERYAHLRAGSPSHPGKTFIALNLFMSGPVLPSLTRSILALADFLGPSSVFVSAFENGSWDHTPKGLAHFAAVLTAMGVEHRIVHDDVGTPSGVDRIDQLAVYRNFAMEPLYNSSTLKDGNKQQQPFSNVLFINDVYFCPVDALELLHARRTQDAHATCGMDYRWRENPLELFTGTGPKVRFFSSCYTLPC